MRVTIIRDDNMVYVDGRAISIDCSQLPSRVRAVQWNGALNRGWIEYDNEGHSTILPNEPLLSLDLFQPWVDAWESQRVLQDTPPAPQ
jgi:hypothetical protein